MSLYGQYANAFVSAIQNVFSTMLSLSLRVGRPYLKEDRIALYEVSSLISISGYIEGCMIMSMSRTTAEGLASLLTGETIEQVNEDCIDAIGELANMIAGNAKKEFPGRNSISVPQVILGKSDVVYPNYIAILSIPCEADVYRINVDVALEKKAIITDGVPLVHSEAEKEEHYENIVSR